MRTYVALFCSLITRFTPFFAGGPSFLYLFCAVKHCVTFVMDYDWCNFLLLWRHAVLRKMGVLKLFPLSRKCDIGDVTLNYIFFLSLRRKFFNTINGTQIFLSQKEVL